MLRHPVKRIVDGFYYRQHATWEKTYSPDLSSMTLEEYAKSGFMVENLYVRELLGLYDFSTEVDESHMEIAKAILRRKFIVGIFEWFDVGVVRFEKYFGWWDKMNVLTDLEVNNCHYKMIDKGDHVGSHPRHPETEEVYNVIHTRNWADMELYFYAKTLFAEQSKLI